MKQLARVFLSLSLLGLSVGAWARPAERQFSEGERSWMVMIAQQIAEINQRDVRAQSSAEKSCAWCLRDWCYNGYCCDQKDTNCNGECEIIAGTCYPQNPE